MSTSMTTSALRLAALGGVVAALHATPAGATGPKMWVSNVGVDSGTCGAVTSPCRHFQQAHDNVDSGGEIGVLNPGDYGTLFITKSVFVTNDGTGEAAVLTSTDAFGVFVEAGVGDAVGLRGLVVDGKGRVTIGIEILRASAVHIQNCVVRNVEADSAWGIVHHPTNNAKLFVSDTIVYNSGTTLGTGGLLVQPQPGGGADVVLDRLHLENNVVGLWVDGRHTTGNGTHVVIRDSVVSGNASDGIVAISIPDRAPAFVIVEHTSSVSNAGIGIHANGPRAVIVLNDDTISRNGTGILAESSGQVLSFGNNKNFNNLGPEGIPTGSFSPM